MERPSLCIDSSSADVNDHIEFSINDGINVCFVMARNCFNVKPNSTLIRNFLKQNENNIIKRATLIFSVLAEVLF